MSETDFLKWKRPPAKKWDKRHWNTIKYCPVQLWRSSRLSEWISAGSYGTVLGLATENATKWQIGATLLILFLKNTDSTSLRSGTHRCVFCRKGMDTLGTQWKLTLNSNCTSYSYSCGVYCDGVCVCVFFCHTCQTELLLKDYIQTHSAVLMLKKIKKETILFFSDITEQCNNK